jgi:hypothetical protein
MSYHEDGEPDWDHIRDTKLFIDELRHEAIELTEAIEASGDAEAIAASKALGQPPSLDKLRSILEGLE